MDLTAYRDAVAPFEEQRLALRPAGAEVIDVHTHLGLDEDGRSLTTAELLEMMDLAGVSRACVFPLHDPDRHPAYRVPNDRVLEWAASAPDRLVPFCRLDPAETPGEEGRRALQAGARGIKLHPRAQAFAFDGPETDVMFSLAEEAGVPMLIHAGRGLPPLADGLADAILRHPRLRVVLAHAAITDMGILTERLREHPGVLYDTCCMFAADVIELMRRVAPERVVFGSDPPYGHPLPHQYMALRAAAVCGYDEAGVRGLLGGTVAQLLDENTLPDPGPVPAGDSLTVPVVLLRAHSYAAQAIPWLFLGRFPEAQAALDMTLSVTRDPAPGSAGPTLAVIGEAVAAARGLLGAGQEGLRPAVDLLHRSLALAITEPL